MNQITKYTKVFTFIGIVGTLIGYLFLLYESYTLNETIEAKTQKVRNLNNESLLLEKNIKELQTTLKKAESEFMEITLNSEDENTVKEAEKLVKDLGIPTDSHFTITSKEKSNPKSAEKFEQEGFKFLLNEDIKSAINAFVKSENSVNGYHQVYEIARYLKKNEEKLSSKNEDAWKNTYQKILKDYSYKMPEKFKQKFRARIQATN